MKTGDIVTITDGSYSRTIVDGKLRETSPNRPSIRGQHWTVVQVDCSFPLEQNFYGNQPKELRNDTIIKGPDGIVFIHSGFLKLVDPPHVWKHGDVFRKEEGSKLIYLVIDSGAVIYCLHTVGVNTCNYRPRTTAQMTCLEDATFLFNIKDKL